MSIPGYVKGYPQDGSSLGQSKAQIRSNLDGTFETLNVDHVNNNGSPGSNPAGYHTIIHEVTQTSVSTVSGVNQIFSGVPGTLSVNMTTTPTVPNNGDTQLYALSGAGILSQLTGLSSSGFTGSCWVGGLLFQWGEQNLSNNQFGSVNLNSSPNFTFPKAIFSVQATLICKTGGVVVSGASISIGNLSLSTSSFSYQLNGLSANFPAFFWLAIGN